MNIKDYTMVAVLATAFAAMCGCGWKRPADVPPVEATCAGDAVTRAGKPIAIAWTRTDDPKHYPELDAWCAAAGPPLALATGRAAAGAIDSLAIVVWNTHGGAGDIARLLRDVEAGKHSGGVAVTSYVALLQEVVRRGEEVPAVPPPHAIGTRRVAAEAVPPPDVAEVARELSLAAFYVPSMRNGKPGEDEPPEDRGNAILSTLPLAELRAIELPLERQRRVAIAAVVSGRTRSGREWRLPLVDTHLDTRSDWIRFGRSFGVGRLHQVKALVGAVGSEPPIVIGGDFNNWGPRESGIYYMKRLFPPSEEQPSRATAAGRFIFPDQVLDYLFFALPDGWHGDYQVIDDAYGSDHLPLIGWVHFGS